MFSKYFVIACVVVIGMLLESSAAQSLKLRGGAKNSNKLQGVTFSGGGFRAHAVGTGVMAGLTGRIKGADAEEKFSNLFANTESFGSNSGGTWFLTQMIYSKNFAQLVTDIGEQTTIEKAEQGYYDEWVSKLLFSTSSNANTTEVVGFPDIKDLWDKIVNFFAIAEQWSSIVFEHVIQNKLDWSTFVKAVLEIPGDLNPEVSLRDAPINDFASGKVVSMAGAVVTKRDNEGEETVSTGIFGTFAQTCGTDESIKSITNAFSVEQMDKFTGGAKRVVPVSFNTKLGHGSSKDQSPIEFLSTPEGAKAQTTMKQLGEPGILSFGKVEKVHTVETESSLFGFDSNQVRILDAATTSSSWLSQIVADVEGFQPLAFLNRGTFDALMNLVVRVSPEADPKEAFQKAEKLRTPTAKQSCDEWFQDNTEAQVVTLTDGGYVENTGMSALLGDALKKNVENPEFVLVLNTEDDKYADLENLFQPSPSDQNSLNVFTKAPIFKQDQDYLSAQIQSQMKPLNVPFATEYLNSVDMGSITAETTDQPFFGIPAGRKVTMHVIRTDTKLWLAAEDWRKLATLVGEISQVIKDPSNDDVLSSVTSSWFKI